MLVVDQSAVDAKSRLVLIALNLLTMRQMEYWREAVGRIVGRTPDADEIMIIGAVQSIGAERLLRSALPHDLQDLRSRLPASELTVCNFSSIAAATSMNRETVRRKSRRLITDGLLIMEEGTIRVAPDVLALPIARDVVQRQVSALQSTLENFRRWGILRDAD